MDAAIKHIGFTGTRRGMMNAQSLRLKQYLAANASQEITFHHGDCVGADDEASEIAKVFRYKTHSHPCNIARMRANSAADIVSEPLPPLERNRVIVDSADVVLAAPFEPAEIEQSGTWATVRYAHKAHKPLMIFWPDGSVAEYPAGRTDRQVEDERCLKNI